MGVGAVTRLSAKRLSVICAALQAGIELAIVRNNLEMEGGKIPAPSDAKRMAKDAVNAMQGIDTCDEQPVAEWNALVDFESGKLTPVELVVKLYKSRRETEATGRLGLVYVDARTLDALIPARSRK